MTTLATRLKSLSVLHYWKTEFQTGTHPCSGGPTHSLAREAAPRKDTIGKVISRKACQQWPHPKRLRLGRPYLGRSHLGRPCLGSYASEPCSGKQFTERPHKRRPILDKLPTFGVRSCVSSPFSRYTPVLDWRE